jgi:hypothetical protein
MAEPENHTIRLLREIRVVLEGMSDKIDHNYADLRERIEKLRKASFGESILGRYATAEVDERIDELEKRVSALESADNTST